MVQIQTVGHNHMAKTTFHAWKNQFQDTMMIMMDKI